MAPRPPLGRGDTDETQGRTVCGWRGRCAGQWRWAVVAAYMAAIFWNSSQTTLPAIVESISDKLLHATAFGALTLVMVWASVGGRWAAARGRHVAGAAAASVIYGLSDEVHQSFVPLRACDPYDLLADAAGALSVAGGLWAWSIIARGRTSGRPRSTGPPHGSRP